MSAYCCVQKAKQLAEKELKRSNLMEQDCERCGGTGEETLQGFMNFGTGEMIGGGKMTCFCCKGSGKLGIETLKKHIFQKHVGCKCAGRTSTVCARDGYKVFGNTTYLCTKCGMVVQFG